MPTPRILIVDDDPLILRIYRDGLASQGLKVETAGDGLAAMKVLHASRPDLILLDLMMPRMTGVDVLKFVRAQPALVNLPVVVLSNSYMDDLAGQAARLGVQKALLKATCTPAAVGATIRQILQGQESSYNTSWLLAAPASGPASAKRAEALPEDPGPVAQPTLKAASSEAQGTEAQSRSDARTELARDSEAHCRNLRQLFRALTEPKEAERGLRLQELYRKIHFLSATAGLTGHAPLAQMTTVFEALLFELIDRPGLVTPSVLRTVGQAIDFVAELLSSPAPPSTGSHPMAGPVAHAPTALQSTLTGWSWPEILTVDDDPVSNRLVLQALRRARLPATGTENPQNAWEWLQEERFGLVLLDIEMPGMDGLELCRRLRSLPRYRKTPVVLVTRHSDFESRARGLMSGATDVVAKPFIPMELAVKVVMLLLKDHLSSKPR